jgi:aspartate/methionine/tyrosine aminotransferase
MRGAIAALQNTEDWHVKMNAEYTKRRDIAFKIMDVLSCEYNTKQVGMFVWAKIPSKYSDSGVLADEILYKKNVFITPGLIFGSMGNRYIRISLCCSILMLEKALERIESKQII